MKTSGNVKHLGLYFWTTSKSTVEVTLPNIESNLLKPRILATKSTHGRATQSYSNQHSPCPSLQTCFHDTACWASTHLGTPLRNPAFSLDQAIGWADSTQEATVANKRISAGLEMGGFRVPHPDETIKRFFNRIYSRKSTAKVTTTMATLPTILYWQDSWTELTDSRLRSIHREWDRNNGR